MPSANTLVRRVNENAFASIVQARPCPPLADRFIFGAAPIDYGPVLLLMPFGFHLAMDTLPSGGLRLKILDHSGIVLELLDGSAGAARRRARECIAGEELNRGGCRRRPRPRPRRIQRLSHPLEGRQPRHPHLQTSQSRVREAAVGRVASLYSFEHAGVRRRAELLYQPLDGLQTLRRTLRPELLAESRKHKASNLLRQVPCIGPIRAARLIALIQTPHRFRSKRQLWTHSGLGIETRDSAQYCCVRGQQPFAQRHSWSYTARTWLVDQVIAREVQQGTDMVINLAAGLDSRPYRFSWPDASTSGHPYRF